MYLAVWLTSTLCTLEMMCKFESHLFSDPIVWTSNRDDLDRKLQAKTTAEILANATNPIVMLSYITNRHGSRDYNTIVEKGNVKVSELLSMCLRRGVSHGGLLRILIQLTERDFVSTSSIVAL